MKEMIERLIAYGWKWVACDKNNLTYVYSAMPFLEERHKRTFVVKTDNEEDWTSIPSCLFPDITFENSPVELKTLLDDEVEESVEQEFIRNRLSVDKESYLLKEFDSSAFEHNEDDVALWCKEKGVLHFYDAQKLKRYFPKEVHEKVYLKNLVKKQKLKKSVWLAVDKSGCASLFNTKPKREDDMFNVEDFSYTEIRDFAFFNGKKPTWEDEPIELFYEVEE